ncbi:MAG TPA: hypothetical protein VF629_23580 [Hymenobacter sp.]|jgi:hypothetical protein|uniref:hypothetical protein n=1 Tax=Hymenobacter sp. TaxID=1898978 RepID=UPI002ED95EBF
MNPPIFRSTGLRQVLRRLYPHRAMGYARQHLNGMALGPVSLAEAVGLLETFAYSLVPREAQGVVHFLLGLNTELCQAGPVNKPHAATPLRMVKRHRPGHKPLKV